MTREEIINSIKLLKKYINVLDGRIGLYHQSRMHKTLRVIQLEEQLRLHDLVQFCNTGEYPHD